MIEEVTIGITTGNSEKILTEEFSIEAALQYCRETKESITPLRYSKEAQERIQFYILGDKFVSQDANNAPHTRVISPEDFSSLWRPYTGRFSKYYDTQYPTNDTGDYIIQGLHIEKVSGCKGVYYVEHCQPNPAIWSKTPEWCINNTYKNYYSTVDKGYIGNIEDLKILEAKGLTLLQKATPDGKTCCIGFNPDTSKWYAWSHRAITSFGVGSVINEGSCIAPGQTPCVDCKSFPIGFKAETLEDAYQMAKAFALAVS